MDVIVAEQKKYSLCAHAADIDEHERTLSSLLNAGKRGVLCDEYTKWSEEGGQSFHENDVEHQVTFAK